MKLRIALASLFVLGSTLAPISLHAGDKKDPQKKEENKETVVNDELTNADLKDKVRTECFCKTYVFKMTEGKNYQIDMVSVWDNYLRLENAAGEQVAADDDGGGFPNARIIYRAPKTGDYTIIATTFSGGTTGKFTLTVKEVAGGNRLNQNEGQGVPQVRGVRSNSVTPNQGLPVSARRMEM